MLFKEKEKNFFTTLGLFKLILHSLAANFALIGLSNKSFIVNN
jgi:hypothetical protein